MSKKIFVLVGSTQDFTIRFMAEEDIPPGQRYVAVTLPQEMDPTHWHELLKQGSSSPGFRQFENFLFTELFVPGSQEVPLHKKDVQRQLRDHMKLADFASAVTSLQLDPNELEQAFRAFYSAGLAYTSKYSASR